MSRNTFFPRPFQITLFVIGLVFLYMCGVYTRWNVLKYQYDLYDQEVPFTLESALQFRMVKLVHDEGKLPKHDHLVEAPQGIEFRKMYSVGSEGPYAAIAKIFPQNWSLEHRVRWAAILIFCLSIPALALWVMLVSRSMVGGTLSGLLYALSYGSVVRSYGIELSRENFAIPMLCIFFAFYAAASYFRSQGLRIAACVAAGIFLALAQCNWDLIRVPVYLFILFWLLRTVLSRKPIGVIDSLRFAIPMLFLLVAGALNPYLRSHSYLLSPIILMGVGLAIFFLWGWIGKRRELADWKAADLQRQDDEDDPDFSPGNLSEEAKAAATVVALAPSISATRWKWRWAFPLAALCIAILIGLFSSGSYNHFADLLKAKLAFHNVKPNDPSLLSYSQRIMWTPALHSTNRLSGFVTFPFFFYLLPIALGLVLRMGCLTASKWRWLAIVIPVVLVLIALSFDPRIQRFIGFPIHGIPLVYLLFACLIGMLFLAWRGKNVDFDHWMILAFTAFSILTFILFHRFHVFVALFGFGVIGLGAGALKCYGKTLWAFPVYIAIVLLGTAFESGHVGSSSDRGLSAKAKMNAPNWLGRPNVWYAQTDALVHTLKGATQEPEPVLANFRISGSIAGYAEWPVILHPKFETQAIRDKVEAYGVHLFKKNEKEFRDWALAQGAKYYVHSRGELIDETHTADGKENMLLIANTYRVNLDQLLSRNEKVRGGDRPEKGELIYLRSKRPDPTSTPAIGESRISSAMRYMVDAVHPPMDAAVRVFERDGRDSQIGGRWFRQLDTVQNIKYQVYKIITDEDLHVAGEYVELAESVFNVALQLAIDVGKNEHGQFDYDFEKTAAFLRTAFEIDHRNEEALALAQRIKRMEDRNLELAPRPPAPPPAPAGPVPAPTGPAAAPIPSTPPPAAPAP